ncbi:MAG: polysaccharide deacetylase family protein [Proteobacteria bacterium]|nr:polysaccharide deacetylase family protein [Pseudomonadota bacterium]
MKLPTHTRFDYVPIDRRPDYSWPDGKRLAVYFGNNIEYFAFGAGLSPASAAAQPPPDHRNYAWRDYGNRVGIWRLFDMMDELGAPMSHNMNSTVLERHPEILERIRKRGDEIIGHGRTNSERQSGMWEEDEKRLIDDCTSTIKRIAGKAPRGWMGPWMAETYVTADLLKEAGYEYILDWPCDDQPFWFRTRSGPILQVPYPLEINDSPAMVSRPHSPRQFKEMVIDQFDEMLEQSRKQPLVCGIVLHPFIVGQPFRLRPLREAIKHILEHRKDIWLTMPGDIATYCMSLPKGTILGS